MEQPQTSVTRFTPKTILLCQLRQIGDVTVSTICVELLARAYPEAAIDFYTEKKCEPVVRHNPHLRHIWELDKDRLTNLLREIVFYWKVASGDYDLIVNCQQIPRCTWIAIFARLRGRTKRLLALSARRHTRPLYTDNVVDSTPGYAGEMKTRILQPLGIHWDGQPPRIYLEEKEKEEARALFASLGLAGHPVVTVDGTHRREYNRWSPESFAALLDGFSEQYPDVRFFLSYGPGEKGETEAIRQASRYPERMVLPVSVTGIRLLAACISQSAMHLGTCSAPRHLAAALDIPTFTVGGEVSFVWTLPDPAHALVCPTRLTPVRDKTGGRAPCAVPPLPTNIGMDDDSNDDVVPTVDGVPINSLKSLTPDRVLPQLLAHYQYVLECRAKKL